MTEQMQPGRELDALVAEAMEWTRFELHGWQFWQRYDSSVPGGYLATGYQVEDRSEFETLPNTLRIYGSNGVFKPSRDNAAAMEAWAWLEENNPWDGGLVLYRPAYNNLPTVAKVYAREGKDYDVFIQGDTYPHAISLAVLEATKERKNDTTPAGT